MQSPSPDSDDISSLERTGYAYYSVGLSLGVIFMIVFVTLISHYCCDRNWHNWRSRQTESNRSRFHTGMERRDTALTIRPGLNEATLNSYPVLLYSETKLHKGNSTPSCCSICLADYKDSHLLRLLPDCGHFFHQRCIDMWLRMNPSCPMCRTSPLSTPLAEVTPLAAASSV
ncbi:hypothetical protein L6164_005601 [Bauhinia variegata]|uniref:Uncharacterized protein n=1 Tax=Bauhinia variegata TaxID=167791 RepID=A0ACB9PRC6_BAUVA|nr:hypothetical protein L6164_005601 [Bauhinia variegata]